MSSCLFPTHSTRSPHLFFVASSDQKKIVMVKKHPPRSNKDDTDSLLPSIHAPDISEDIVYSTAMKPSKRGVAPGPMVIELSSYNALSTTPSVHPSPPRCCIFSLNTST